MRETERQTDRQRLTGVFINAVSLEFTSRCYSLELELLVVVRCPG